MQDILLCYSFFVTSYNWSRRPLASWMWNHCHSCCCWWLPQLWSAVSGVCSAAVCVARPFRARLRRQCAPVCATARAGRAASRLSSRFHHLGPIQPAGLGQPALLRSLPAGPRSGSGLFNHSVHPADPVLITIIILNISKRNCVSSSSLSPVWPLASCPPC